MKAKRVLCSCIRLCAPGAARELPKSENLVGPRRLILVHLAFSVLFASFGLRLVAQNADSVGYTPPSDSKLYKKTSNFFSAAALTYYVGQEEESYKLEIFPFRFRWLTAGLFTVFSPDISSENEGVATGHLSYALPVGISLPIRTWKSTTLRLDATANFAEVDDQEDLPTLGEVQVRLDSLLVGMSLGYRRFDRESVPDNFKRYEGPFAGITLSLGMPLVDSDYSKPSRFAKQLDQLNAGPAPDLYRAARENLQNGALDDAANNFSQYIKNEPFSRWSRSARSYLWFIDTLRHQNDKWRDAALSLAQMREIGGAALIGNNPIPVLFGPVSATATDSLSPLAIDDFINVVRSIDAGDTPGVSIEPLGGIRPNLPTFPPGGESRVPSTMVVRYLPNSLASTHLGYLLFEADRALKSLALGRDNLTGATIRTKVDPYRAVPSLMRGRGAAPGYFAAPIFVPREILARKIQNAIIIDAVTMGLRSQSHQSAAQEFVHIIEANFAALAGENQALAELTRIGRMVAIARWLKDVASSSVFPTGWSPSLFPSPKSTPTITAEVSHTQIGNMAQIAVIAGGVLYSTPTTFRADSSPNSASPALPELTALVGALEGQQPHGSPAAWIFDFQGNSYQAVQLPSGGVDQ